MSEFHSREMRTWSGEKRERMWCMDGGESRTGMRRARILSRSSCGMERRFGEFPCVEEVLMLMMMY